MISNATAGIAPPPRDVAGWVRRFAGLDFPVLHETAAALEELRAQQDVVDARTISELLSTDPLMTLKVLSHASGLRRERRDSDPETVLEALVLTGVVPFFRHFGAQRSVDEVALVDPRIAEGFAAVLRRSRRAARFALAFAVHRMDNDAEMVHEAALLHEFAELLLWLDAPDLALEIAYLRRQDPTLRSAAVQRQVLNAELVDVQHALMLHWRLPPLLVDLADDRHAQSARARCVMLAIRLARHSAAGWDNPALPDDIREIADLLTLGEQPTRNLLRRIDRH